MQRLPDTGHIKIQRRYRWLTDEEIRTIYRWCEARDALGNQKVFAARCGLSVDIVQVYVAKYRASQRWRAVTHAPNFWENLIAEDEV